MFLFFLISCVHKYLNIFAPYGTVVVLCFIYLLDRFGVSPCCSWLGVEEMEAWREAGATPRLSDAWLLAHDYRGGIVPALQLYGNYPEIKHRSILVDLGNNSTNSRMRAFVVGKTSL